MYGCAALVLVFVFDVCAYVADRNAGTDTPVPFDPIAPPTDDEFSEPREREAANEEALLRTPE